MSAEKIISKVFNDLPLLVTPEKRLEEISERVDINVLLIRLRQEKNKEIKTNLVFLGLALSLILVTGLILSL